MMVVCEFCVAIHCQDNNNYTQRDRDDNDTKHAHGVLLYRPQSLQRDRHETKEVRIFVHLKYEKGFGDLLAKIPNHLIVLN